MTSLVNKKIKETILKYDKVKINKFQYGNGFTANFIEHASEKYKVEYKKSSTPRMITLLYNKNEVAKMSGLRPSSTGDIAYRLCKDKFKLESYLVLLGLNTLKSRHYDISEYNLAQKYVHSNKEKKYVIKPLNLAGGKGIKLNIDEISFEEAWHSCINTQLE